MKLTLNIFEKGDDEVQQRRPLSHLFGGRVRTSTVVLIVAFLAVWWVYDTYRPEPPPKPAAPQVVPPGFVPDPNYTWVPRSRVQQPTPTVTVTPTPTTSTPAPPPPPPPVTTTTTPPFVLPTPPCLLPPPFCPPSASPSPAPQQPQPGPGPVPTSAPPAS
ncbi:hypothetical protein A5745_05145 [Mycobacterium sp. IS-2888]|uniref:hypothetical protein n=1 Tax=unclassified Mycobacterium TaxID=2642494 RepID=UPI00096D36D6|nr:MULTISPECIES: hypothetical protein [unclassified Mycobacterium]OMC44454.1 hypothetical protein A5744_11765 [Mycobacterium sp. IS-1264]OMC50332.1 hypothetical protein A5745_05145 [Mycobacterium sp. IS-2888]